MVNMIAYINRIKNKEPRSMDSEPRNKFDGGGLTMDSIRVLQNKQNFRDAWKNYKRSTRGSRPLSSGQFFEIWATENMATGGSAGQLVRNTVDGSRPGYNGKYVKKGYQPSKWKDLPKKDPEFKKWLKENKITDFDTSTARKDIVKKYQIATTKKNYIKSGDLAKILSDVGSPYQPNGLRDQFAFAKRTPVKGNARLNAQIKKSKKVAKIIEDALGSQFSLADTRKGQSVLEGLPIHHADDSRYFKKGKDFNKQLKTIVEGLVKEYDTTGLRANTIDNIFDLYKDKKFMRELKNYKGGKVNPESYLFKKAFANNESGYAFMQLARVMKGELELEGITSNKHQGNKIIKSMVFDAKGKKYGPMWTASYNYAKLQLSPYMKTKNSYASLTGTIKKAFKEAGVIAKDIDEIFPLRTGTFTLKKGSDAYSNFIQVIDSKINQGVKVQFDRIASGTSQSIIKELADAKKTGDYSKVENLVAGHNEKIEEFYTNNPKAKNVKLQEFPWDSKNKRFLKPKEVFESQYNALKGDYKTIPSEIRKGMEQFHRETGLSINPGTRTTLEKSASDVKALTQGKAWNKAIKSSKAKMLAKTLELAGITDICSSQRAATGGRMGFAEKVCGVKFAEQNEDAFMKKAADHKRAAGLFKSGKIRPFLMKAKNWAKANMGPTGWIGGELLVVGLGSAWDMSQGKGWKEAMDSWTGLGGHFGQAEARLKEIGMEQGYNEEEINDAMKIGQLMDLSTKAEEKQWQLDQVQEQQDIGGTARVKYNPNFPGAYKPTQGKYQDPKRIRDLKTETPKMWEKGNELYESLKDFGSSTELYNEMQQKKAKEEYDKKMRLREMPHHFAQQFKVSGEPEFEAWTPEYAKGGLAGLMKKYYD
jgi:hypothetical protein